MSLDPGWSDGLYEPVAERYLALLVRVLTRSGFGEPEREVAPGPDIDTDFKLALDAYLERSGLMLVNRAPPDPTERDTGLDWPAEAETMIGVQRLRHLALAIGRVVADGVEGDILEAGVWRGGACILARGALDALGDESRTVWLADSFEGLPKPDPERYPADEGDPHWTFTELAVPRAEVEANFARYGLLDGRVRFLEGWFEDTLAHSPVEKLSLMRVDGDMYGSTIQVLEALYPRLSIGGICIVDDYGAVEGCRAAVHDFRRAHSVSDRIETIDWTGIFWRKSGGRSPAARRVLTRTRGLLHKR